MFAGGRDPPIITGSGVDPSVLRWVAWPVRHTAAFTESRFHVAQLIEISLEGDPEEYWEMNSSEGRVQLEGYKDDPLYRIRGLLRHGVEHLTDRQSARLDACLDAGDPNLEVSVARQCYQLRSAYHAGPKSGKDSIAENVIGSFPSCPTPDVARLGRTRKAWKQQALAYFDTDGVSKAAPRPST